MMKNYETMQLNIVFLNEEDVIRTSPTMTNIDAVDAGNGNADWYEGNVWGGM